MPRVVFCSPLLFLNLFLGLGFLLVSIFLIPESLLPPLWLSLALLTATLAIATGIYSWKLQIRADRQVEELETARRRAEAASRVKSQFLAAMSHEIRTPLNGVLGMAEVLAQTSLRPHQVEMVELLQESARQLLSLIEDILDFSKIEAGRVELEQAPLNPAAVIEKTCLLLDHTAIRQEVEFTVFLDPALPARVRGDAVRLRQILTNLLSNAIKFSSGLERPGRVQLRAAWDDGLVLTVRDNGIGIDEATRQRLFRPFTQADASTTRRFGGTGLGLVITCSLVRLMGGTLTLESRPGEGSVFQVRLPLPLLEPATPPEPPPLENLDCVLIGCDPKMTADIAAVLRWHGARVHKAATPEAALELAAGLHQPLCVWVLDQPRPGPPDSACLALLEQGRRRGLQLRLLSIGRGRRRRARCPDAGFVQIDANLLTPERLVEAVAVAAGRRSPATQAESRGLGAGAFEAPQRAEALEQNRLILVAEDNATNRKVIERQLALLGLAADFTADGAEALRRWENGDYALVLTDLHMPNLDGYHLARAIRERETDRHRPRTPILALSANALAEEAERCRACGMDGYLSKPVPLEELRTQLRKWLPQGKAAAASGEDAVLDTGALKALVGDDSAVVHRFLAEFAESAAELTARIAAAAAAQDWRAATGAAHTLKSSARAVGAFALAEACLALETAAGSGTATDCRAAAGQVADAWTRLNRRLTEILKHP